MPLTAPVAVPVFPGPNPDPTDKQTYGPRGRARWLYEEDTLRPGLNALADSAYQNAQVAESAAAAASSFVGVAMWAAGTNYATGTAAISPTNYQTYRRESPGGVDATDPAASALWTEIGETRIKKSGDTMGGNLNVPSLNGGQLAGRRRMNVNGAWLIAQTGTSFPAAAGHVVDCGIYSFNGSMVSTVSQQADAPAGTGLDTSLRATVTTADASIAAGEYAYLRTIIEGFDARRVVGRTFSVGFWVRSSKVGVHCAGLKNSGSDRSYVFEFTVLVANTWEYKSLTIVGGLPSAGTWNFSNGNGLVMSWALCAGTTYQTTAGAWNTGNFLATANQVNACDTVGNVFAVTGFQVEEGAFATPYEHWGYAQELAACKRYYEALSLQVGEDTTASTKGNGHSWSVEKRIVPVLTVADGVGPLNTATVSFAVPGSGTSKTGIYQSSGTNIGTVGAYGNKIVIGDARLI